MKNRTEGTFVPVARYDGGMDHLIYQSEDVPYVADRVDPFLTLLWRRNEDRLVGIKLKGFRHMFNGMKTLLPDVREDAFLPLIECLKFAIVYNGEKILKELEKKHESRLKEKYDRALAFLCEQNVGQVQVTPEELRRVVAVAT
jgi:hypothetical protein